MKPKAFVDCSVREKDYLVETYMQGGRSETAVGIIIEQLGLPPERLALMRQILDGALTDAFHTVLMGLRRQGHTAAPQGTQRPPTQASSGTQGHGSPS